MTFAAALAVTFSVAPSFAAEHKVLMLNYGTDGSMVFEPSYVKAEPGDTITFVPQNSSHYVQSYAVPEGVTPRKGKLDEAFTVTVEKEGVYLYYCPPHLMMAMIGVIQSASPSIWKRSGKGGEAAPQTGHEGRKAGRGSGTANAGAMTPSPCSTGWDARSLKSRSPGV